MSPSQKILENSERVLNVILEDGKRISFRRPTALDTLRLFKAAGPDLSRNDSWLSMASLAFTVLSIDDIPVPQPKNEAHIESLVSKLGDAGLSAVAAAIFDSDECSEDTVGNLQGTPF